MLDLEPSLVSLSDAVLGLQVFHDEPLFVRKVRPRQLLLQSSRAHRPILTENNAAFNDRQASFLGAVLRHHEMLQACGKKVRRESKTAKEREGGHVQARRSEADKEWSEPACLKRPSVTSLMILATPSPAT